MERRVDRSFSRAWLGVVLVVLGAIFLMDTFDIVEVGHVFATWWPLIIIAIGFLRLRAGDRVGGTILFVLGIVFLSATLDIINWGSILRLWPVILILVGLSLMVKTKRGTKWGITSSGETSEDFIKSSAIFGGIERKVTSDNFQGGEVTAIFGGVDLDLRQAKVPQKECNLDLTALFGGVEVVVPPGWQVSVSGTPIFGGIENGTTWTSGEDNGIKVHCRCTVIFGGVEIKN